jgi:hypothetical protein
LLSSIIFERKNINVTEKKAVLFFFLFVFTLFRGLRWNTGTDWGQYYDVFRTADWNNILSYSRNSAIQMEPGYMLLNTLIKSIGGNYTLFLLATNFFVLLSYVKFSLTNSKTPIYVLVLLMFSTQFFPVRIGIAVGFIIFGLCGFTQGKHLRVLVCTLIAASIHSSAVIFIPVYCCAFITRIPTALAVGFSIAAMLLIQIGGINDMFSMISFGLNAVEGGEIAHKFDGYLNYNLKSINAVSTSLNAFIFIASLIPFGYLLNKTEDQKNKIYYDFLYNMYFVFVMIGIFFSSDNMLGLKRLQNYFAFAFPLLFSMFIVYGKKKYPQFSFAFIFCFIAYALFRSYTMFFGGYPDSHFPYISIFSDNFNR